MSDAPAPRLSVIIPAFDEEARIGRTLDDLAAYFARVDYSAEILVVDDGSRDGTAAVVRAKADVIPAVRLLQYGGNRGKGFAVRHGMAEARGDYRLFFDADGATPIDQIEKCWPQFAAGAAACIGSRALAESDIVVRQPWHREWMGRTFNGFVRLLTVRGFRDTQCGFKVFTAEASRTIFPRQRMDGFGFDVELLFIAGLHGLVVCEVPVKWIDSPSSRINPLRDSFRMFVELLKIRRLAWRGAYR